MSASNSYSYAPNTYNLIQGAARLVSAIQTGETLDDSEYSDMLFALTGLIAAWQASGIHVWCEQDATLFLQPDQVTYQIGSGSPDHCCLSNAWFQTATTVSAAAAATALTVASTSGIFPLQGSSNAIKSGDNIGVWLDNGTIFWTTVSGAPSGLVVPLAAPLPSAATSGAQIVDYTTALVRPLRVPGGRRYIYAAIGGQPIETPLSVYSRLDYGQVPNKTTPGTQTAFFFDPQLTFSLMNAWPNPNSAQSAMKFTAQRPLQDFLTQANTADLPIEWSSALRFNLAVEIAPEYDVPAERFQMIKGLADEKLGSVQMWDREVESIYFGVENQPAVRN
jgi:hypothetical protein